MDNNRNASFGLRFLATITEFFIFLSMHLLFWFFLIQSSSISQFFYNFILYLVVLALSPLGLLHSLLFTYYLGGTIGKLVTGLKVVDRLGQRLNFKRVFFRQTIGYQFSSLVFGLGFLSILKYENKLAWHDKASGSKVIVAKNLWMLSAVLAVIFFVFNLYLAVSVLDKAFTSPLPGEISEMFKSVGKSQIPAEESTPSALPKLRVD
ncbi:RDD family protein [Candidatus Daviesbacteria bacterium]|nr:RDD family protein [Candidatus Daviesbacteria bacterium]